jgi:tryptophan-rich hypothetical protein
MAVMSQSDPEARPAEPPPPTKPTKPTNRVSPKKLLLSKWTAVTPQHKEKHFVVVRVIEPEPPEMRIDRIELEAVHSRRTFLLHWRDLTDGWRWRQGWV